jgi:uncharacterized membrane protein YebE (DUF533 family)
MFDPKALLDAVVRASEGPQQKLGGAASEVIASGQGVVEKAKSFVTDNPQVASAALVGLAGLVIGGAKTKGIGGLAKLGGLALIGGLAYKAYQSRNAGSGTDPKLTSSTIETPPTNSAFHPDMHTEDDALLYLRAMIAAAAADGRVDDAERARIVEGMKTSGIDPAATRWLEEELASPADVDDLAQGVETPEKAARVYTAARIAIEPDTIQEREFLRLLGDALGLDAQARADLDEAADALRH